MAIDQRKTAEAFSHHDFAATYDAFADDIVWVNVGGDELSGRKAIVDACEAAATYFAGIDTEFTASRSIVAHDTVIVTATGRFTDGGERSTVSACDIYDFADDRLVRITSYNVEV